MDPMPTVHRFHLKRRALFLAKKLWESFAAANGGRRIATSGDIIPHGSLRSRSLRRCLSWAESSPCKLVTQEVAQLAVDILVKQYRIQYPIVPGFPLKAWRKRQVSRIVHLCYRAKKNSHSRTRQAKHAMAEQDTLIYDGEAGPATKFPT